MRLPPVPSSHGLSTAARFLPASTALAAAPVPRPLLCSDSDSGSRAKLPLLSPRSGASGNAQARAAAEEDVDWEEQVDDLVNWSKQLRREEESADWDL